MFSIQNKCGCFLGSGWTLEHVKETLLLDNETLRRYVQSYREGGLALLLKLKHKGSTAMLLGNQVEQLCHELNERIYLTTQSIIEYTKKTFKVGYSQSGMRDLLHRLGYEYKKPKLVPGNPDHEAQEIFAK